MRASSHWITGLILPALLAVPALGFEPGLTAMTPLTEPAGVLGPLPAPVGEGLACSRVGLDALFLWQNGRLERLAEGDMIGYGFVWAPDGRALIVRERQADGRLRCWRISLDASRSPLGPPARRLSPPARFGRLALALFENGPRPTVLLEDPDSRQAPRFVAARDGAIWLWRAGRASRIDDGTATCFEPHLSPSGALVCYRALGQGLHLVEPATGRRLALGRGTDPAWTLDGRHLLFARTTDDGHRILTADLFMARAADGRIRRLTDTPRLERRPRLEPDGRHLVFDAAAEPGAPPALWRGRLTPEVLEWMEATP